MGRIELACTPSLPWVIYLTVPMAIARPFDPRERCVPSTILAAPAGCLSTARGARTPALAGLAPDPLTAREREVAMLAARGLTTAGIAERLVLSIRTVENHLQRGYEKLGVANRSELRLVFQPQAGPTSLTPPPSA
jgi:DNA-binding NarL/FixJ family response regulator